MTTKLLLLLSCAASLQFLAGCKSSPVSSESIDPEVNFDALWKGYDANYSFFEIKNIN